jgi:glycosyltransferase domain-containing protein
MDDFTLVIPTHNRPPLLRGLLAYLRKMEVDCSIVVIDSSRPDLRALNVRAIEDSGRAVDYADYSDQTPHEKWRLGIHRVKTPYCALCADDDIIIAGSINRCLDVLRANSAAAVTQGYSFSFQPMEDQQIELNNVAYYSDSILGGSPLDRLDAMFAHYQACAYGFFRTRLLQTIFDTLRSLSSSLFRELLWSALAATNGQIIRVPCFSYGRSMGPSHPNEHWHPLEWLCKDPSGFFTEYLRYRDILASAVLARVDNTESADEVKRNLDLIHMRYLVKHAPDSAMGFIIEQQLAGVDFERYWPRHEIHVPLIQAAAIGSKASNGQELKPVTRRGNARSYVLHPNFYDPVGIKKLSVQDIALLIEHLDHYSS